MSYSKIIGHDNTLITCRPILNNITGSFLASAFLTQILYIYECSGRKPFYKFISPNDNPLYLKGTSWIEQFVIKESLAEAILQSLNKYVKINYKNDIPYYTVQTRELDTDIADLYKGEYININKEIIAIKPKTKQDKEELYKELEQKIRDNLERNELFMTESLTKNIDKTQTILKNSYKTGAYKEDNRYFKFSQVETLVESVYKWTKKQQEERLKKVLDKKITRTEIKDITNVDLYARLGTFCAKMNTPLYLDDVPKPVIKYDEGEANFSPLDFV